MQHSRCHKRRKFSRFLQRLSTAISHTARCTSALRTFLVQKHTLKKHNVMLLRSVGTQVFFTQYTTTHNLFCIFFVFPLSHTCLGNNLTPNNKVTVFSIHRCSCIVQDLFTFLFLVHLPAKKNSSKLLKRSVCVERESETS